MTRDRKGSGEVQVHYQAVGPEGQNDDKDDDDDDD